jgi:hypothetical protein
MQLHTTACKVPFLAISLVNATIKWQMWSYHLPDVAALLCRSLGMMMWEMISGAQPWQGLSQTAIVAAVRECHLPGV